MNLLDEQKLDRAYTLAKYARDDVKRAEATLVVLREKARRAAEDLENVRKEVLG